MHAISRTVEVPMVMAKHVITQMMITCSLIKASDFEVFTCTVTAHVSFFFTFNKYLHSAMSLLISTQSAIIT